MLQASRPGVHHIRFLIRNGTVVTSERSERADVLIEHGVVSRVAPGIAAAADRTWDATDRLVIPGGVDVHTHLDMPYGTLVTADDFESGTRAAAFGGTTTIVDFAVQAPGGGGGTLHQALDTWLAKARGKAVIDFGLHLIVTDLPAAAEPELDELVAEGVPSFKLFMAYPGRLMVDDATILRALLRAGANGGTVMLHAENGGAIEVLQRRALAVGRTGPAEHALTRPPLVEAEAASRAIALAELAGAPLYIVHVSAAETVEAIAAARARGVPVSGETCPQYLVLTAACDDERFVMSPPLRDGAAQERLWRALAAGDLAVVATDHCPFNLRDKRTHADFTTIPGGVPGIETRLSLLWDGGVASGRFDARRFVELTATNPARLFGLFPRKGTIAPGSDADIVVWDPERETTLSAATHHMRVDYSPYEGRVVRGAPDLVLSRGQPVVERGAFMGRAGAGQFLRRAPRAD